MLTTEQIERIVRSLHLPADKSNMEMTIEVNPGDVTTQYLSQLRQIGFNRLSMGIQSFCDERLRLIGRRHTAQQAIEAVQLAQQAGFDNISIDLIYGLPGQTMDEWQEDIRTALTLQVQHISAYNLIFEEGTLLTRMLEEGQIEAVDEETEMEMFDLLDSELNRAGFEHYEVSNWGLPGRHSRHNSSYWTGIAYLGLGAGAHSYLPAQDNIPAKRLWNSTSLRWYEQAPEQETLTDDDLYNEYIMLGLRTNRGIDIHRIQDIHLIDNELAEGLLVIRDNRIVATQAGRHILNRIIQKLLI